MKSLVRLTAVLAASATVFAACQKEEEPITSASTEILPSENVQNFPDGGLLVSATKTGESTISDYIDSLTIELGPNNKTYLNMEKSVLKTQLAGIELFNFKVESYRIRYKSNTIVAGKDSTVILSGDIYFIADSTGHVKRHLESVTLFNTIFNTGKYDSYTCEYYYLYLRTLYNAMLVFPLYQGGDSCDNDYVDYGTFDWNTWKYSKYGIYATPCEYVIKGKQAIDCELAALEFINSRDDITMADGYYTENVGISNGGGAALAVQYLLEKDSEYKQYADDINLLSTYVGAGCCSVESLMDRILTIPSTSDMYTECAAAYLTAVEGSYLTWGDDSKYYSGLKLEDFFNMNYSLSYNWYGSTYTTKMADYLNSFKTNAYYSMYGIPAKEIVNTDLMNADSTAFVMDSPKVQAMLKAFSVNEAINHDWNPKHALKIVQSNGDDFLGFDTNYDMYKNLSHNGLNPLVRFDEQDGLTHGNSTVQCIVDVVLHKHPFYAKSDITYEDLYTIINKLGIQL